MSKEPREYGSLTEQERAAFNQYMDRVYGELRSDIYRVALKKVDEKHKNADPKNRHYTAEHKAVFREWDDDRKKFYAEMKANLAKGGVYDLEDIQKQLQKPKRSEGPGLMESINTRGVLATVIAYGRALLGDSSELQIHRHLAKYDRRNLRALELKGERGPEIIFEIDREGDIFGSAALHRTTLKEKINRRAVEEYVDHLRDGGQLTIANDVDRQSHITRILLNSDELTKAQAYYRNKMLEGAGLDQAVKQTGKGPS